MTTEPMNGERGSNPFHMILKTAIGLGPLGIASAVAYQNVSANAAINPVAAVNPDNSRLTNVVRAAGSTAGRALKADKARSIKNARALASKIMEADELQKVFQHVEETNVLAQSLLDFIQDPANGLEQEKLTGYKERLLGLMNKTVDSGQAKEAIAGVVKAIQDDPTGNAAARWADNYRQYQGVAPYLTSPKPAGTFGEAYTSIPNRALSQKAKDRLEEIKRIIGDGRQRIDLVQMQHGDITQQYARIFAPGDRGTNGRFLTTLPLDLGTRRSNPMTPMFMGENLQTGYMMPRQVLDAQAAAKVLQGSPTARHREVIKDAGIDLPDYLIRRFGDSMQQGPNGRRFDARGLNAGIRQFGEIMPRFYSDEFTGAPGLSSHLKATSAYARNMALVVGFGDMNKKQQYDLMTELATRKGFDPSSPGRTIIGREEFTNTPYGTLNFAHGSILRQINSVGEANRTHFPVLSRVEQLGGRQSMFIGSGPQMAGRGRNVALGATFASDGLDVRRVAQSMDFGEGITGSMNRLMLMDVGSGTDFYRNLEGSGAAFHSGRVRTLTPFTKPVLEPGTHGNASSALLDFIMSKAKEGELIPLTRAQLEGTEELKGLGFFAGIGPNGLQHLRNDPRMTGMRLGYRVHRAHDKTQIHITGFVERELETLKVFSSQFKGMMQNVGWDVMARHISKWDLNLQDLGVSQDQVAVTTGDMLKKAPGFVDMQLRSAYAFVSGDADFDRTLKAGLGSPLLAPGLGTKEAGQLGRVTNSVIRSLAASKATASEAGHALAGIYGVGKRHGVGQEAVAEAIANAGFADPQAVLKAAQSGRTFAVASMVHGTGPGDYGVGQAGLERRHIQMINERLRMAGMSRGESSDFIAGILQRKRGMGHHVKTAKGMMEMMESVAGIRSPVAAVNDLLSHTKTFGLKDIEALSAMVQESDGLQKLVDMNPQGFILDLTSGATTRAEREIAAAAKARLGQGQVFIPGRDVMDAVRQTMIKTADGFESIDDRFTGMIGGFLGDVFELSTQTGDVTGRAVDLMDSFKSEVAGLTSASVVNLTKGKVRGSVSGHAGLGVPDGMNPVQEEIYKRLLKRTKGRAVFMDTNLFMTNLGDFMGSGGLSVGKAASMAETYFTGLERAVEGSGMVTHTSRSGRTFQKARVRGVYKAYRARGLTQIVGRNPVLSVGNTPVVEAFRPLTEVGQTDDRWLSTFLNTTGGQEWQGKVSSWKDVTILPKKDRRNFFISFAKQVPNMSPKGGGILYLPRMMHEVHGNFSGSKSLSVDFGVSGAAIGDWDGDTWFSMMLDQRVGSKLRSTLTGSGGRYTRADVRYKIVSQVFAEEAKFGLDQRKIDRKVTLSDVERIKADLMKEDFAQSTVGQLDIRTNMMRFAISQTQGEEAAQDALAFLKIMQEHLVIKSKKMEDFVPYAERMNVAIDELAAGRPDTMVSFLKDEIFAGTKLAGEGIEISGIDHRGYGFLRSATPAGRITLESVINTIQDSMSKMTDRGEEYLMSEGRLLKALTGSSGDVEKVFGAMRAGESTETAVLGGALGRTADTAIQEGAHTIEVMASRVKRFDRKTMGLLAVGLLGSMVTTGIVTSGGFAPEPLEMDGQYIPPELRDQIAASSVAGHRDPQVPPDKFNYPGDPYTMMARPINMSQTYMNRPNSYQLRGNVTSLGNVGMLGDYMGTVSGGAIRGGLRIEDARRPITPGYADKLLGEY